VEISQRAVQNCNHRIYASVIIYVSKGDSAMWRGQLEVGAGLAADVLEFAVSQIAQNRVGLFILAIAKLRNVIENVAAGDEQVLPSVVVEIEDSVSPS